MVMNSITCKKATFDVNRYRQGSKKVKTRSFHEFFENGHMDAIFYTHTLISLLNNMQYKYLT